MGMDLTEGGSSRGDCLELTPVRPAALMGMNMRVESLRELWH